ncbi:hypothetical protein KKI95_18170 [Xenorhabdus bovienii]|uniref:hypothetical protein n=1 Tax=Xenorhabdus bovienii TaxID=40576 RepID=UPI0023B31DE6|nr:hypothetical protein [Xenorhabdus bovienii]MDE9437805.1 hypothetical protein [Xenorhabdus bovienii]
MPKYVRYIGKTSPLYNVVKNRIYEFTEENGSIHLIINGVHIATPPATVIAVYPHPHAGLIAKYAELAFENEEPWRGFQYRTNAFDDWRDCSPLLTFNPNWEFRLKPNPQIIRIGEWDVPEPERRPPLNGTRYFIPNLLAHDYVVQALWINDAIDQQALERRLVHLTSDAANTHAHALISLIK